MKKLSPVIALAFAEDAQAIASWAEAQGFPEDARAMREFATKIRREIPASARWKERVS